MLFVIFKNIINIQIMLARIPYFLCPNLNNISKGCYNQVHLNTSEQRVKYKKKRAQIFISKFTFMYNCIALMARVVQMLLFCLRQESTSFCFNFVGYQSN